MPQRPNVVVYQEYDEINVVPDIPDLEALVVGPCYQLLDYLDDKTDIYAADYGADQYNSPYPPAAPPVVPEAVVISSLPGIATGAEVQSSSVRVFFDACNVNAVSRTTAAAPDVTEDGVYALGDNLFYARDAAGTGAGHHFSGEGVEVGDTLLATATASGAPGATTGDHIMTVKEVLETLHDYGGTLDFITNGVQAGDSVVISGDANPNPRNGTYSILRVRSEDTLEFVGTGWLGNTEGSTPSSCTIDIKAPSGASRTGFPATLSFADYSEARMTADFTENPPAATIFWRFERTIADEELATTDFSVSGNTVTVNAGVLVDLTTTLVDRPVTYAKIYVEYKALRQDLQEITELSNFSEMEDALGKYDARNPLFVGAVTAKANTATPISVYGVASDDLPGYLDFIERIDSKREVYAIAPMTYDTTILAAVNNMCETLADPNYALTNGTRQKFRVCLGALDLPTEEDLVTIQSGGASSTTLGTAPSPTENTGATFTATGLAPALDFQSYGILPGDLLEIYDQGGTPETINLEIRHVSASDVLRTTEDFATYSPVAMDTVGDYFEITRPNPAGGSPTLIKRIENGVDGCTAASATAIAQADLYTTLELPGANFVTNGVVPGDIVQIPSNPEVNNWTTYTSYLVQEVLTETRLIVVNNGPMSATVRNELPYATNRATGAALTSGQTYARVVRDLSKNEQVTAMVATANSFSSSRMVLSYPNSVDVSSLVDGGKTRSGTSPEVADAQPGYYLAAALCGQTSGEPPQQGFTNLGIAGISRIYNADDYFSETQMTNLSNGGVNVYSQTNPNSLPLSIHSVTTDTTSLEFNEYMIVKDFDFVAWTNLDALLDFIGKWNVSKETIEFIRQALVNTNDALKSRFVAKIGAPLQGYSIEHVGVSEISADRIEAFVDVDLPVPLNTIGLHLVA